MHLSREQLEAGVAAMPVGPRDGGTLEMIVVRPDDGRRETPDRATCTVAGGVAGDDWHRRPSRHSADGGPDPERQVTVVDVHFLDLVSGGDRSRWPLAGDQLVVDLDLSDDSLATGDRLRIGEVVLEVTAAPHTGCRKFTERFGVDAVRVANDAEGRRRHLRGIHARVVGEGTLAVGDRIERVTVAVVAR